MQVADRMGRLRKELAGGGTPALVVTSLTNIRYLTGFTGSAGMLFVLPDEAVLLTDGRYESQAAEQIDASGAPVSVRVAPAVRQRDGATELVGSAGVDRLALEAAHISWARQRSFEAEWFPGVELVPTVGLVEELRRVKDAGELDRLAEAARIADEALDKVRPRLADGLTEAEFGRILDFSMRELGASGPSFETIVASGPNGAKPHHRPGDRVIGRGEPVVIDFGALVDGYCSDMTRTVWVDGVADPDLRRAVTVVLESQAAGVAAVRAGATCASVDAACRSVIGGAGWGDRFVHGTGHGVGLDIHEAPSVAASSTDTLVAGHVVTVEPGVYLPGLGGVRIEDTVVVTDEGCRPLTRTAKDHL
ncbi:MAG TPA: aminopeptidase P family protein [Acidimicrobiales bacterium]|nr:aminopeptidase P family protein [Acidimicrobiales bacterium]